MSIFKPGMTALDGVIELAQGNPGAITAVAILMKESEKIDPQNFAKELAPLLELDELELRGSQIWLLFKDICGEDPVNVFVLFRARQLGLIPRDAINKAVERCDQRQPHLLDVIGLRTKVQEQLVSFYRGGTTAHAVNGY